MEIRSHRQAEYGIRREKLSQGPSRCGFHQLARFLVAESRKKGLVVDPATNLTAQVAVVPRSDVEEERAAQCTSSLDPPRAHFSVKLLVIGGAF